MRVWWLKKPAEGNFGDLLTPHIFDYFGIKCEYAKRDAQAIAVGSIARYASANTIVLGSGIISAADVLNPSASWRLVRGPQTRKQVLAYGGTCPEIYGDAGALLPEFCDAGTAQYDVGIVPHFIDNAYVAEHYANYHCVNLLGQDALATAKRITECRQVISSSLHGIIAAHAYGIPAAWVKFGDRLQGDDIKFRDYYESVGLECKQSTMQDLHFTVPAIDIKPAIKKVFEELKHEFA